MTTLRLGQALRAAQLADPAAIPEIVTKVAADLGAVDVTVYLIDFAQTSLEPLPDRTTHAGLPSREEVGSSMAGRAFLDQQPISVERDDGARVWVPIVEGSDRTGVLALTVPDAPHDVLAACEELGLFVGYLIATQARSTDLYNLRRRRRALSLAASMQWDLLPPLVLKTRQVTVATLLEPAYDVGGDCFDYALNGSVLDLAVFDPMGHGEESSLIASLCVGSYRHDRREAQTLEVIDKHLDETLAARFPETFATGQLVRVDVQSGVLSWINAGHPPPMLIRGGQVILELEAEISLPWGLHGLYGEGQKAQVATASLEPGDSVLFYTDGVVEAHAPGGEQFGPSRLADLVGQHASDLLEPEEIVRLVVRSVLDHQGNSLADDATLVMFQWHPDRGGEPAG